MRKISIEKVTLNIGAGEAGPKLDNYKKMLEKLSDSKVVITNTHKRSTFGGGKGKPIGAKTTLRGDKAKDIVKLFLQANENQLKKTQFDTNGNLSFGIAEYINIPGVKYDPDIGILGLDVCITLTRPGFRIKKKAIKPKKVGIKHKITKEEAMEFMKKEFDAKIM